MFINKNACPFHRKIASITDIVADVCLRDCPEGFILPKVDILYLCSYCSFWKLFFIQP